MSNELQSRSSRAAEWQAQERALDETRRRAPVSGDAHVDAYRAVFQAISLATRSEPPLDFAERTLRALREAAADERIERWMIRVAGLIGVVALAMFAGPTLLDSLGPGVVRAMPAAGMLASPLLWAAVAGVVTAGLMDSWLQPRPIRLDVRQML